MQSLKELIFCEITATLLVSPLQFEEQMLLQTDSYIYTETDICSQTERQDTGTHTQQHRHKDSDSDRDSQAETDVEKC